MPTGWASLVGLGGVGVAPRAGEFPVFSGEIYDEPRVDHVSALPGVAGQSEQPGSGSRGYECFQHGRILLLIDNQTIGREVLSTVDFAT